MSEHTPQRDLFGPADARPESAATENAGPAEPLAADPTPEPVEPEAGSPAETSEAAPGAAADIGDDVAEDGPAAAVDGATTSGTVAAAAGRTAAAGDLAAVLRVETANLSAWPAAQVAYDGTWVLRRTAGHRSKRLNGLTFLDPADGADAAGRLKRFRADAERLGFAPAVRLTPLTPPEVVACLDAEGWTTFDETLTMVVDLAALPAAAVADVEVVDEGPREEWAAAMKRTGSVKADDIGALVALLGRILPESALSVALDRHTGKIAASALAVADRGLVGLFDVGTVRALRGRSFGRRTIAGALAWGRSRGARTGYLQVLADNPAVSLYQHLGFRELYRGRYRLPPTV